MEQLTRREREVLLLRADGLQVGEVAEQLEISRDTVSVTSKRAMKKLGANRIEQAIAIAYHAGLFTPAGRRLIQINRAQALGFFNLSQQLAINDEIEFLDQGNMGEVYVRAGLRRFVLPRRGGFEEQQPDPAPAGEGE